MFLSILLAFALVQEPVKPQPDLVAQLDAWSVLMTKLQGIFETGIMDTTKDPEVGILVDSAEEPGPDGLHALTVVTLYAHSPAGDRDIRLGDRILRINQRRIEHESADIAQKLIDAKADDLRLEIERGGKTLVVTLRPRVLECYKTAVQFIGRQAMPDLRAFQDAVTKLRQDAGSPDVNLRNLALTYKVRLADLYTEFANDVDLSIRIAVVDACAITFK